MIIEVVYIYSFKKYFINFSENIIELTEGKNLN